MGNLTRTPYSEITATLEGLERFGVTREHFTLFRGAASADKMKVANAFIHLADLAAKSRGSIFKLWKTLKLGTGLRTAADFRKALKNGGFQIGDWANDILGKPAFTASETELEVNLVIVSNAELGYPDGATREDTYRRAKEFGLKKCPAEVGPQLRRQYRDQPIGERLLIGMEPITVSDGHLGVFSVARDDDDQWLHGHCGDPDRFWYGRSRWVFLLGK